MYLSYGFGNDSKVAFYSLSFCSDSAINVRSFFIYCQEWEIDRLLQFCMHNFMCLIFARVFKANSSTKICPSQKDQLYPKMEGRRSRPSNLLYIYPFQEGYILFKCFDLKTTAKIKKRLILVQNYSSCLISISYYRIFYRNFHMGREGVIYRNSYRD